MRVVAHPAMEDGIERVRIEQPGLPVRRDRCDENLPLRERADRLLEAELSRGIRCCLGARRCWGTGCISLAPCRP
jgi:hypothetical protein